MIRRLLLSLLLPLPLSLSAEDIELELPDLPHPVQISLPSNFDPAKKHPTLFYYHGTGGRPTTSLMRSHAGENDWIIVGMTYREKGQFQLSPQTFAAERKIYHHIRQYLSEKHSADPARLYTCGFSKGGWFSNLLLQAEPTLAGGIILGAGHFHTAPGALKKYAFKKPIHIGLGRKDGNYPLALKALLHHRKLGADVTFEVWPALGHDFPQNGSDSIQQWLALRANPAAQHAPDIPKKLTQMLKAASALPPLAHWDRLLEIKAMPYYALAPKDWQDSFNKDLFTLEASPAIATEAMLFKKHRRLIHQEITNNTLSSLQQVNASYLDLASQHPRTRQGQLMEEDYKRTAAMLKNIKVSPPKKKALEVPSGPLPQRRIPGNPLVR